MRSFGTVNYHHRSGGRQAYRIDAEGVSGSLVSPAHDVVEVSLFDMRLAPRSVRFDRDGLTFVEAPSGVSGFEEGQAWKGAYVEELRELLVRELGAKEVVVFDHTLRVDHPAAERRPARNVHTDYSPEGARARLADLLGEQEANRWERGHYAFVNVWRPVSSVVRSAPLGFIRPESIHADDWIVIDLIYPHRVGQILGLCASPDHEWIYQSAMTPREAVVFNIFDNRGLAPVVHSAVDLVPGPAPGAVRKSIESRTLIRY